MTREETKSCIGTIKMLQRLAYNIHGVMDVIDADNCKKIIKALEQEPCEDCISRQAVLAIAGDSCLDLDSYEDTREFCDEINDLPSVTPQSCGDCVSREAVENAIKHAEVNFTVNSDIDFTKHKREVHEIVNGIVDAQIKALRDLPSVTPQPKMGRWIVNEWGNISCSECGCTALYDKVYPGESVFGKAIRVKSNFCPTCGAKLKGSKR